MTRSGHSPSLRYSVSHEARLFSRRDELVLVGGNGSGQRLAGDSAELVRAILDLLQVPRTRDEIVRELERLSGGPIARASVVDEALALLRDAQAIDVVSQAPLGPAPARGRLLLGVSGAVAAAGAPELVQRLQHAGFVVRVALTPTAARFVSPRVLEALTHAPVARSLWRRDPANPVPHMRWAEWAELVLICPASATTIARIVAGDCSELVAAIVTATRAPVVIVPSMNGAMYASPAMQRNLEQLRLDGRCVVGCGVGEELADAPEGRVARGGAAPSWSAVVDVAAFVAAERPRPDWNALYAADAAPPFCADRFDADVGEALAQRRVTSGRVLDCGCGSGTVAVELSRRGFAVSAVDVAPGALVLARARDGSDGVRWLEGDVTDEAIVSGSFDVIIDRGCVHGLPGAAHARWATAMARLCRPGGWLVVKSLAPDERAPPHTHAFTRDELRTLLDGNFVLDDSWETIFQGPLSPPPRALFCIFRRA
jgi:hypothetical protein